MVFFILVGDDNIADIGEQVAANLLFQYCFCGSGQGGTCILEAFGHMYETICAEGDYKASLGLVLFPHIYIW